MISLRTPLKSTLLVLIGAAALWSCHPAPSARIVSPTLDTMRMPPEQLPTVAAYNDYHFSFYFSGSGIGTKPEDTFKMDTNGLVAIKTVSKSSKGDWRTLNAFAKLEPEDLDTLRQILVKGNIAAIDSSDLTQVCVPDEIYVLDVIPTPSSGKTSLQVQFSACAADFNLLLEPQRRYFRQLVDWFERMRVKYRPYQPE